MSVKSMLVSNDEVIAEWDDNHDLTSYFAEYADAFEVVDDAVELPLSEDRLDTLFSRIREVIRSVTETIILHIMEALALGDRLIYRETVLS